MLEVNKHWRPFEKNQQELLERNMRIIKTVRLGLTQRDTTYLVEFLCCGVKQDVTHERIKKRVQKGQRLCRDCGRVRKSRRVLPVVNLHLPLWPRPGTTQSTGDQTNENS